MDDFGIVTAGKIDHLTFAVLLSSVIVFLVYILEQIDKGP